MQITNANLVNNQSYKENKKITSFPRLENSASNPTDTFSSGSGRKINKFTLAGLITAACGFATFVCFPAARLKIMNLFKKQVSEDIINNSISKCAKEMANLDYERMVFINEKTGEVFQKIEGKKKEVNPGIRRIFLERQTISGHNHPEQIFSQKIRLNGVDTICNFRCKDVTFSFTDIDSDIRKKSKHTFVVTSQNIHHLKLNNNYDEKKFLDYLEKSGKIELKDRQRFTIYETLKNSFSTIPIEEFFKTGFNTKKEFKEMLRNGISSRVSKQAQEEMKKLANHMGWTYWVEPLTK